MFLEEFWFTYINDKLLVCWVFYSPLLKSLKAEDNCILIGIFFANWGLIVMID